MSKITNDGLTRSGTGYFIAVPVWKQWASKGEQLPLLQMKFSDRQSQFSRVFNFAILRYSQNSQKVDAHEKIVLYIGSSLVLRLWSGARGNIARTAL